MGPLGDSGPPARDAGNTFGDAPTELPGLGSTVAADDAPGDGKTTDGLAALAVGGVKVGVIGAWGAGPCAATAAAVSAAGLMGEERTGKPPIGAVASWVVEGCL